MNESKVKAAQAARETVIRLNYLLETLIAMHPTLKINMMVEEAAGPYGLTPKVLLSITETKEL